MQSTVLRNPQEIYGVLRAVAKAIRIYKTDEEQALGAIARFAWRLNDSEALEETRRMNVNVLKDIPSPPVAGIRVVRDLLRKPTL